MVCSLYKTQDSLEEAQFMGICTEDNSYPGFELVKIVMIVELSSSEPISQRQFR